MRAVLERDLVAQWTRPRAFFVRGFVAAAAVLMVLLGFLGTQGSAGSLDVRTFDRASWIVLTATVLLTPAFAVDAILAERQGGTLPLVLCSPVGPRGFVAGKLLSRTSLALAMLAAAWPALAVCHLLDEGSWHRVARFGVLEIAVVLELVSFALWASTFARTLGGAINIALILPAIRWWGTGWASMRIAEALADGSPLLPWIGYGVTPLPPFLGFGGLPEKCPAPLPAGALLGFGPSLVEQPERIYLLGSLLFALATVALLGRRLAAGEPAIRSPLRLLRRRAASPRREDALLGWNPVLWRDLRPYRGLVPKLLLALLVLGGIGAAALLTVESGQLSKSRWVHARFVSWGVVAVSILAALEGASALVQERARGTLQDLRLTPLRAGTILAGKVLGASLAPLVAWILTVLAIIAAAVTGAFHPPATAAALLLATFVPAAWGILGLRWGLVAPSPGLALLGTAAAFVLCFLGFGWWLAIPVLFMGREAFEDLEAGSFLDTVVLPSLFLGPAFYLVQYQLLGLEQWVDPVPFRWTRWGAGPPLVSGYEYFLATVWSIGCLLYLWVQVRDLPRRFREAMDREDDLAASPRFFPTLRETIERRRLEREERRSAVRAPSREWTPAGRPLPPGGTAGAP